MTSVLGEVLTAIVTPFDKDGAVTKEELDSFLDQLFATADGDHDGGVTLAEAQAYHAAKAKRTSLKDAKGKREQP